MTDDEKITYLANLFSVMRTDGELSLNETNTIEEVRKRIKATKTIAKKAGIIAEGVDYKASLMGLFSTQVANLEDMILVSLADGGMDSEEKNVILDFARCIGLNSAQIKATYSQMKSLTASKTRVCPSCSTAVSGTAKFCPSCGDSLADSEKASAVATEYEVPHTGVVIEFAESTASGFADGVRKAKSAPIEATCKKGTKTWYMAAWPKDQVAEAADLAQDLKGMRNRKVWVDGKGARWDDVFSFAWCAAQRSSAYRPTEHCFGIDDKRLNLWGCKNAQMDWVRWADWFSFGQFKKSGAFRSHYTFVFDKKRMRHVLESNLFRYKLCPHLQFDLIEELLNSFPDEAEVKPDGLWAYKEDYNETPGSIKINEKVRSDGYSYTNEYFASGVVPRTPQLGLELLKNAIKACGRESADMKAILTYQGEDSL